MKTQRSKKRVLAVLLAFGCSFGFLALCAGGDPGRGLASVTATESIPIVAVPTTISQPGSYHFSENLTLQGRYSNAITINTDDVTIDLGGYRLIGPGADSGSSNNGIYMNGRQNVEIRNGTVTEFGNNGIWEENSTQTASGHRVIDVRVVVNGGNGVLLNSQNNLIKDCTISFNSSYLSFGWGGIRCSTGSTVADNVISYNSGLWGIVTDNGCVISGNTLTDQGGGISVWYGCHVTGNALSYNDTGIRVGQDGNYVKGNTIRACEDEGVKVEGSCNAIEENVMTSCRYGIYFNSADNFYANNRSMCNTYAYGGFLPGGDNDGGGNVNSAAGDSQGGETELATIQQPPVNKAKSK